MESWVLTGLVGSGVAGAMAALLGCRTYDTPCLTSLSTPQDGGLGRRCLLKAADHLLASSGPDWVGLPSTWVLPAPLGPCAGGRKGLEPAACWGSHGTPFLQPSE